MKEVSANVKTEDNAIRIKILLSVSVLLLSSCNLPVDRISSDEIELGPGEVIFGPEDIVLGATEGALETPIGINFVVVDNPIDYIELPRGAKQESSFYSISSTEAVYPSLETPFIFGVTVPEGAPVEHLAVVTTVRSEEMDAFQGDEDEFDDIFESEPKLMWQVLAGHYDEENNVFLTPIYSLSTEGRTVVLVSGEQFASPPANPAAEVSPPTTGHLAFSLAALPSQFRFLMDI